MDDFIERINVYEFEGKQKFLHYFEEEVVLKLGLDKEVGERYMGLALLSIFNEDPEQDLLDEEKIAV